MSLRFRGRLSADLGHSMNHRLSLLIGLSLVLACVSGTFAADTPSGIKVGDTILVVKDGVKLMVGAAPGDGVGKGVALKVTALNGDWIGVSTMGQGPKSTGWIRKADVTPAPAV